ncbi:MAG: hypothetical protein J6Y74_01910 [Clostridia bacterium]|nr:hypothetical protein [Clostridia bacterium]
MGKTIDKILLSILLSTLLFVLFFTLTKSLVIGTLCALLGIGIIYLALKLIRPRTPKDKLSKRDFIRFVLLNGNSELKERVENSFPNMSISTAEGQTLLENQGEKSLIYYAYKFGALSEEDIAKAYRIARGYSLERIYVLTNHSERKALAVTEYIPQRVTIIGASTLYKYLLKRGGIPSKSVFFRKKNRIANFFRVALSGSNVKYYCIAGLSTSMLALLSPLRIYYLAFSFLNLLLAILSLANKEGNVGDRDLFKE